MKALHDALADTAADVLLSGPQSALLILALVGLAVIAIGALIVPGTEDEPEPETVWTAANSINRRQARR